MAQRILVIDDDRGIVRWLRSHLEKNGYRVLVANDGETALNILRRERPDLVLLDLMLTDRNDQDLSSITADHAELAAMPVLMFSIRAQNQQSPDLPSGPGASASKLFNPSELVAHVQTVLRRVQGEPDTARVIQAGKVVLDLDRREVQVAGHSVHLTSTELGLLWALIEQPGRALSRLEMIENGLGQGYEGTERTVDSHIKNLRRKLARAGVSKDPIETVFGVGYRLAVG